ncbi:hypothetical protein [Methylobacter sp.]|uniref:hypothetical protein n=1 Tax=Methylobacter sp. TaxID=2051955 RepID=UPI00121BD186|nr:hypothetical protein [Methylobacter sp.]TAK59908.1 MAG: hypothetical protein EPO18_19125 [Methylobacter sp.]
MQTYLPFIKSLLSEWYLTTLNNPLYAAALAAAVWLLTATLYSIRIASLKRKKAASEKAGFESLNAMQQQLQQSQEALAETVEQMEKAQHAAQDETQRALALEQLIYQRNQQVAGTIQTLATNFDLGERPLLASEDVKADSLWQQHDKVVTQLIERLRTEQQAKIELQQTCQAETAKLAEQTVKLVEKEALLEVLQTTLAAHTNQLSKLEQTLEEQRAILQQQNNAQQILSETLKNFQPVTTQRLAPEPAQPVVKPVEIYQQPIQHTAPPAIEETLIAQPVPEKQVEQVIQEPQASVPSEEETQIELTTTDEAVIPAFPDMNSQPVEEETSSAPSDLEQQPVTPAKGSLGKIKNLFGKKQQPVKTEPQWTAETSSETQPSSADQQPDDQKAPGKLKGFYSKLRPKK